MIAVVKGTTVSFFFFNDTATTEIYTLSLHDALPIFDVSVVGNGDKGDVITVTVTPNDGSVNGTEVSDSATVVNSAPTRSEEHTSELQSRQYLVCRLLLEKKNIASTSSVLSNLNTS